MTNKPFSRRTKFVSQKRWLYKAGSRENTKIFLRGDTLRKWCITRPVGRVRIETSIPKLPLSKHGLHHPAGWPGAD